MKRFYASIIFFFAFGLLNAQVGDWSPLPFGVKNVYKNLTTNEVVALKVDSIDTVQGAERGLVWRKRITQLGGPLYQCDTNLLNGIYLLNSNYRNSFSIYHVEKDSVFRLRTRLNSVSDLILPFPNSATQIHDYGNGMFIRIDSVYESVVLSEIDSVVSYSILDTDSSEIGIHYLLSKQHGLVSLPKAVFLPSFHYETQELVGFENLNGEKFGLEMPVTETFWGRSAGDIFLYKASSNTYFTPRCYEYKLLEVYSENGELKQKVTNYNLDLEPKQEACMSSFGFEGSKFYYDSNPIYGMNNIVYSSINDARLYHNGLKYRVEHGYIWGDCFGIGIDAPSHEQTMLEPFGVIKFYMYAGSYGDRDVELIAAFTAKGNYGSWPVGLGLGAISNNELLVYPNPSNTGVFTIENQSGAQIRVYDYLGKLVLETSYSTIDLSNNPNGIYFLEMLSDKGIYTQKLVKN